MAANESALEHAQLDVLRLPQDHADYEYSSFKKFDSHLFRLRFASSYVLNLDIDLVTPPPARKQIRSAFSLQSGLTRARSPL